MFVDLSVSQVIEDRGLPYAYLASFSRLRVLGRAGPLNVAGGLPDSHGVGNSVVPNSLGRSRQVGLCSGPFCRSDDRMALPLVHVVVLLPAWQFCDAIDQIAD